jgi:ketosteroid isomerase-like protein
MDDSLDILRRLQALEDLEAIKNLHREYLFMVNNRQWKDIPNCFSEDAVIQLFHHPRATGMEEIRQHFAGEISRANAGKGRDAHFTTMPVIKVDGDRATGHWMMYIMIAHPETGNAQRIIQGRYSAEYVKIAGQWKYKQLVFVAPWPRQPDSTPKVDEIQDLNADL